jgi:hypothetical protein
MSESRIQQVDDLVLELKGLVLVRDLLRERGTNVDELETSIVRVREKLARKVQVSA